MCLKKIIFSSIKTYIFFLLTVLFLNFSTINVKSSTFKVDDIEISEPFEVNFKKKNVIDKAFKAAFEQLTKMTVVSSQSHKIKDTKISDIKNLIESFNIKNEKFVKDSYLANFEVMAMDPDGDPLTYWVTYEDIKPKEFNPATCFDPQTKTGL